MTALGHHMEPRFRLMLRDTDFTSSHQFITFLMTIVVGVKTVNSALKLCTYLCLKSLFLQQGTEGAGKRGKESEQSHSEIDKGYFNLVSELFLKVLHTHIYAVYMCVYLT